MAAAIQRIVVRTSTQDKKAIAAKARKLEMPVSELMRRGAFAYDAGDTDAHLGTLADATRHAADRAGVAIDDALAFIDASNKRIEAMQAKANRARRDTPRP